MFWMNVQSSKVSDKLPLSPCWFLREKSDTELRYRVPVPEKVKGSMPGEQHLAIVSPWPAPELHLDVLTNLHTYLQAANLTVGTVPLKKGVVALATVALSAESVQWGQKTCQN